MASIAEQGGHFLRERCRKLNLPNRTNRVVPTLHADQRCRLNRQDRIDVVAGAGAAVFWVPPDVVPDVLILGDYVVGERGNVLPGAVGGGGGATVEEVAPACLTRRARAGECLR